MCYEYRYFRKAKFQRALCEILRQVHEHARHSACAIELAAVFLSALERCAMMQAAGNRNLFLAEAVNDPHGGAVISLASAAVAGGINRTEIRMFVVHFDQANRPAFFEFHVEPAAGHPGIRPSPMTERIEASLAFQVVAGVTGSDEHFAKRSDLVPV